MTGKPKNLHEAVYQALGAASMCWEDVAKAGVFDSTQAAIIGADLIKWVEEWHRSEQPSYLPSGMDEFAAPQARLGSGFVEMPGARIDEATLRDQIATDIERAFAAILPPYMFTSGATTLFPDMETTTCHEVLKDVWECAKREALEAARGKP